MQSKPITLAGLRRLGACSDGMAWIEARLGPDWTPDREINLADHLEPDGLNYIFWAIAHHWPKIERYSLLLDCAEHVAHIYREAYPDDSRVDDCNAAGRAYLEAIRGGNAQQIEAAWAARDTEAARAAEAQYQMERIRYYLEVRNAR